MQQVTIRPYESGTMIPICGLDLATDKLRQLFKLSVGFFQASCAQEASPARWLYFLSSNQQFIIAKLHTLDTRITETQEKCQQQALRLTSQLQEDFLNLSERERDLLKTKIEHAKALYTTLETIAVRLHSPKEQLEKLKALRLKKITHFSVRYQRLRYALYTVLINTKIIRVDEPMLTRLLAYLFLFANREVMESAGLQPTTDTTLKKIQAAVLPLLPTALQTTVMLILTKPGLWNRLKSAPNVAIAVALVPVLIAFFREFDTFQKAHTGLISGVEILKIRVKHIEQCYVDSIMHGKVEGVMGVDLQTFYPAARPGAPRSPIPL